jgi:Fur family zinc uptake transcriptional regulator
MIATIQPHLSLMSAEHPVPLTKNQALVLGVLENTGKAMGAYDILEFTRSDGVKAAPQVYRALEKLRELGLVHRLDSINAYLVCDHHGDHDHHEEVAFAICEHCGNVDEIPVPKLDASLKAPLADRGFSLREAHLEILGECETCAAKG